MSDGRTGSLLLCFLLLILYFYFTLHADTPAARPPGTVVAPGEVLQIPLCGLADCNTLEVR